MLFARRSRGKDVSEGVLRKTGHKIQHEKRKCHLLLFLLVYFEYTNFKMVSYIFDHVQKLLNEMS